VQLLLLLTHAAAAAAAAADRNRRCISIIMMTDTHSACRRRILCQTQNTKLEFPVFAARSVWADDDDDV
jgi:hypothetical protein